MIQIKNLSKVYEGGFKALDNVNLTVNKGEIFALLGPNGAGKTTLISIICGILNSTSGSVTVNNYDIQADYKKTRALIGLVPQELTKDAFETVWNTVRFTRGLFGQPRNDDYIQQILEDLSLADKKHNRLMTLSGGMKRRVSIAKALSHEPCVLFLDEPTAGVDVELRKSMWKQVRKLKDSGVTVILTTHYIEEAEEMADRVGIISKGKIILTEDKNILMKKLGKKELVFEMDPPITKIPEELIKHDVQLIEGKLVYKYDSNEENNGIAELMTQFTNSGINYKDLYTKQSSLEEIFVNLVSES